MPCTRSSSKGSRALPTETVAVLGAGSWGTALSLLLARNGQTVRLWDHDPAHIAELEAEGSNERYLPGIPLGPGIVPVADLTDALEGVRDILVVVPSHGFRAVLESVRERAIPGLRVAWATKGFEQGSGRLLDQVVREVFGEDCPHAVISGPSFAAEVAARLPTAVTVAASTADLATQWAARLHGARFRAYTSTDRIGVQVGGAVKNVMAIAAGISDGLGFGANSRAALITRGLAEITRLGLTLGGQAETFMGLAGLGDLVLTCTDDQSRNRRMGLALAAGQSRDEALTAIGQAVEGVNTADEVRRLAARYRVDMPICEQTCQVLFEGMDPGEAVERLLTRELKAEFP